MARVVENLIGQTFNRWKVLDYAAPKVNPNGSKTVRWLCECVCGTIRAVEGISLKRNNSTSCGCYNKERAAEVASQRLESLAKYMVKEYNAFGSMKSRCYNLNVDSYTDYGERGIKVCDEWLGENGFYKFFDALGPSPEGAFLDRIDPNGNYEPSNCRWATASMSAFNKTKLKNNTSGRTGVSWNKKSGKWRAHIRVKELLKESYLGSFDKFEDAVKVREAAELEYFGFIKEE